MKYTQLFSAILICACAPIAQAAPDVTLDDLSPTTLNGMATARQQASMKAYEDARAKARQERVETIKKAKEITEVNNAGLKKTIQRRAINHMLPACEREPEAPRNPNIYVVRGRR